MKSRFGDSVGCFFVGTSSCFSVVNSIGSLLFKVLRFFKILRRFLVSFRRFSVGFPISSLSFSGSFGNFVSFFGKFVIFRWGFPVVSWWTFSLFLVDL